MNKTPLLYTFIFLKEFLINSDSGRIWKQHKKFCSEACAKLCSTLKHK